MLNRLRQGARDEGGFTLIELLVVILIIGILAAIAIPAFLNQTSKANDSQAKELARTAQTTAMTYASDNNGSFAELSTTKENEYEKSIPTSSNGKDAFLKVAKAIGTTGFEVETESPVTEDTFKIEDKEGTITRTCVAKSEKNKGGCPSGDW